jgi:hypothetical protein
MTSFKIYELSSSDLGLIVVVKSRGVIKIMLAGYSIALVESKFII